MKDLLIRVAWVAVLLPGLPASTAAQQLRQSGPANSSAAGTVADSGLPARFVIGVGDVLAITFWRDEKLSRDVLVRPDGKISLPLLNDVTAAGYTPEQLAGALTQAAVKYITEPDVSVVVKEIHSRRVFVVGEVATPGAIALSGEMNVLQLIAMAGGLHEYADKKHILIIRTERGQEKRLKFNYDDVLDGKNTKQNILLQPGDTIVVR
jgi:polysaccharide export outer membrane protein